MTCQLYLKDLPKRARMQNHIDMEAHGIDALEKVWIWLKVYMGMKSLS